MNSKETYVLVTDGIIEMTCVANSLRDANNLFLDYLKNKNDKYTYKLHSSGQIYEYEDLKLNTVHFIFTKNFIDFLRKV